MNWSGYVGVYESEETYMWANKWCNKQTKVHTKRGIFLCCFFKKKERPKSTCDSSRQFEVKPANRVSHSLLDLSLHSWLCLQSRSAANCNGLSSSPDFDYSWSSSRRWSTVAELSTRPFVPSSSLCPSRFCRCPALGRARWPVSIFPATIALGGNVTSKEELFLLPGQLHNLSGHLTRRVSAHAPFRSLPPFIACRFLAFPLLFPSIWSAVGHRRTHVLRSWDARDALPLHCGGDVHDQRWIALDVHSGHWGYGCGHPRSVSCSRRSVSWRTRSHWIGPFRILQQQCF